MNSWYVADSIRYTWPLVIVAGPAKIGHKQFKYF